MIENRNVICLDFIYEQGILLFNFNSIGRSIVEIGGNFYKGYDDFMFNVIVMINKVILIVVDFDLICFFLDFIINF